MDHDCTGVGRRRFLKHAALGGAGLALAGGLSARWSRAAGAPKGTVTLADIGVGDPGGDWWRRERLGPWLPPLETVDPRLRRILEMYGWGVQR